MKKSSIKEKILIIILFVFMILLMIMVPSLNTNMNVGKLIINEVMLINNNTITDKFGKYNDYIELYNGNDFDINLYGYFLTDSMKDTKKWSFPDVTIKSNDYLVIFASGKNLIEDELHTNFKLDQKGETIALSDSSGKVISKVYVKETMKDTSFGYNLKEEDYVYYYSGTPGKENTGEYEKDPISNEINDSLKITEYTINNKSLKKSNDNKYYSLIEIYNDSDNDTNLEGYYLSNDIGDITKYQFPDISIKSHEYKIIMLSGIDKVIDDEIHTNFKVENESIIIFSNPKKTIIEKLNLKKLDNNHSLTLIDDKWIDTNKPTFGSINKINNSVIKNDIVINEVSIAPVEAIELYNQSDNDITLTNYSIGDKSGAKYDLSKYSIKKNGYLVLKNSNLNFNINNSNDIVYLYYNDDIVNTLDVGKLKEGISVGLSDNKRVYYKNITLGSSNSSNIYKGYSMAPLFSMDGGYAKKGDSISLSSSDGSIIYYTTDGSFPNSNKTKYTEPIKINKNTVIKAIGYKDGFIESDVISRTFITDRTHDIAFASISTDNNSLFGGNGLITNYTSNSEKKVNFEFYDSEGNLGVNVIANAKLSGMDSRKEPQKSISIFLRKKYGVSDMTYPFFPDMDYNTYSSILFRNSGEDPKNVRIMDAALTRILKGEMDIDMQQYRPVAVYLNGSYYGLYSLRERLNGDYVESKFGIDKDDIDLIKYSAARKGSTKDYNNLVNYIKSHDPKDSKVYEYLKSQIDVQELINYFIVESFYGNTDLGNIRYWKSDNGKWRWMLYDLDWSLWNTSLDMGYPIKQMRVPAATYLSSSVTITRRLYRNSEFKDLYLSSLAKYLKTTFKPDRMKKIVDELSKEIENEMEYHIKRWGSYYPNLNSMSRWKNNLSSFKNSLTNRYNKVVNNLRSYFNLSNTEYNKYFGDLK